MNTNQLITVFYRYNRFAPVIIVLYVLVFGAFFYMSMDMKPWVTVIGFAVLIFPPLYGAIRKKSLFSLRTWDERKLILTPDHIQVGEVKYPIADLRIALQVHGFDGFAYSKNNKWITRNSIYGDQNYLSFRLNKKVEDFQFYLKDYNAYIALYEVIKEWKNQKIPLVLKESFEFDFVRDQVLRFAGKI